MSDTVGGEVRRLQYVVCHCCRQTSIGEHEVCTHGKRQQFSISQQWAQGHRLSPAYSQMVLLLLILYVPVCAYVMGVRASLRFSHGDMRLVCALMVGYWDWP